MATIKVPAIAEPINTIESLRQTSLQLKEAVEIMSGQRGSSLNRSVTWDDLVKLGLIPVSKVPKS